MDARNILEVIPEGRSDDSESDDYYTAKEFAELARQELRFLQQQWSG
jgi:hypothetical protein